LDTNEFILYERKRGDSYRLLSACFYLPQKELYLEEGLFENLSMLFKRVCPDGVIFSIRMGEAIQKYSDEDMAVECARLFIGPYELKAPPYGSVYLDKERRVMGDSTMDVIKMYHEEGLSMDKDFKELPDHIAVELEFMNYLIYREINTCVKSKLEDAIRDFKIQEIFLKHHLGAWVPEFSKAVIENSKNHFYINLAKCTAVFIKMDMDYLSATLRKIL